MKKPQSSSIELSENAKTDKINSITFNTHDTLMSSNDPAGLFLNKSTTSIPQKSPINPTPAVDNHRNDADVINLNQLHKANNCSNCGNFICGKCKVHKYSTPYIMIDCEQWEYRGKKI